MKDVSNDENYIKNWWTEYSLGQELRLVEYFDRPSNEHLTNLSKIKFHNFTNE